VGKVVVEDAVQLGDGASGGGDVAPGGVHPEAFHRGLGGGERGDHLLVFGLEVVDQGLLDPKLLEGWPEQRLLVPVVEMEPVGDVVPGNRELIRPRPRVGRESREGVVQALQVAAKCSVDDGVHRAVFDPGCGGDEQLRVASGRSGERVCHARRDHREVALADPDELFANEQLDAPA
jgi:hypothetical protein